MTVCEPDNVSVDRAPFLDRFVRLLVHNGEFDPGFRITLIACIAVGSAPWSEAICIDHL